MNPYPRAMDAQRHDDVERFRALASPFLMREPARNQLPIMIVHTLVTQPEVYPEFRLWTVLEDDEVVAAAVRTPPHNVALADPVHEPALDALVDVIAERRPPRARRGRQPPVGRALRPALGRRDGPGAEGVGGPGRVRAHTSDPCPWIVRLAPAGRSAGPSPDRSLERSLRRRSAPTRTGRAFAAALAARRELRRGRRRGVLVVGGRRTPSLDDRVLDVPAGSADRAGLHPARGARVAGSPRTWWHPRARR